MKYFLVVFFALTLVVGHVHATTWHDIHPKDPALDFRMQMFLRTLDPLVDLESVRAVAEDSDDHVMVLSKSHDSTIADLFWAIPVNQHYEVDDSRRWTRHPVAQVLSQNYDGIPQATVDSWVA